MLRLLSGWRILNHQQQQEQEEQQGRRPLGRRPTKLVRSMTDSEEEDSEEEEDSDNDDGLLRISTSLESQQQRSVSGETMSMSPLSSLSESCTWMEPASPAPIIELAPLSFKISVPESGGQEFTSPFYVLSSLFRLHIKLNGFDQLIVSLEYLSNNPLSAKLSLVTQIHSSTVCLPAEQSKINITYCSHFNTRTQLLVTSLKALNLRFGPRNVDLCLAVSICE